MTMISFRTDEAVDQLLSDLARPGETRSDTIRRALLDAARLSRREQMRRESLALRSSGADRAEADAVQVDLEDLRAW